MKKIVLFIVTGVLMVLILASCKKVKPVEEQTPKNEFVLKFKQTDYQTDYWFRVQCHYEDKEDVYFMRTRTMPIDTIVKLPKGKVTKVEFELVIVGGYGDANLQVQKNGRLVANKNLNENKRIHYLWQ